MMKKKYVILVHLLFWFYLVNQSLFPLYIGKIGEPGASQSTFINDMIISLLLNAFSFYGVYFSFPYIILIKNRFLLYSVAVLTLAAIVMVRLPVDWLFWKFVGNLPEKEMVFQWVWVWNELRLVIITGIYAILIRFGHGGRPQ